MASIEVWFWTPAATPGLYYRLSSTVLEREWVILYTPDQCLRLTLETSTLSPSGVRIIDLNPINTDVQLPVF